MAPIERLAMRLRKLRQQRGMTQQQLADATRPKLSREYIARLEAGRHDPALSTIEKLAKALKVKPADLLK